MDQFIQNFNTQTEEEFTSIKRQIVYLKYKFQSTKWTDAKLMIESANEIWALENRLRDAMEVRNVILDNYRTGE